MTKFAENDLHEIDHYISADNPSAANRILLRIVEVIEFLTTHPTMGRAGRLSKTRELVVSGTPFIVVYQVRTSIIAVSVHDKNDKNFQNPSVSEGE